MNSVKLDKIPDLKEIKNERYFQIRDLDSHGCGSFYSFCVKLEATLEEIGKIASDTMTNNKTEQEEKYIPFIFSKSPYWRPTIKVIEMQRKIKNLSEINSRTGRNYENIWLTKRKGLKFTIIHDLVKIEMSDGSVYTGNGYSFGKEL